MTKLFNISQNEATAKMYLDLAMAKCDAAMRTDRFEAAIAANKKVIRSSTLEQIAKSGKVKSPY